MALKDVSFINITGKEISLNSIVNEMINSYQEKLEVGETAVTDFNEGSEIRNLLEAFAVISYNILQDETEASKLPFIRTSYGTYLDAIGENPFINLPRISGASATGDVTFSLSSAQEFDVIIPFDTLLETSEGIQFSTNTECTIYTGETSTSVGVTCLSDGYEGNIAPDELTVIVDNGLTELLSVTNNDAFVDGSTREDDEVYRQRLLDNVQSEGFGTLDYYTRLGESVDGVHDVSFVSDASYTRKVLVNGFSKPTPDSVLLDVLAVFSDVEKKVLGHSFTVDKPSYVPVNLTFTLSMLAEWSTTDLTSFVTRIVDGGSFEQIEMEGLDIGEDLTHKLLSDCFELLDDVVSMSVKVTGQSSEFESTSVTSNQVVKLGTLTFNQTVV